MGKYGIAAIVCLLVLCSCGSDARIKGRLTGAPEESVSLELITPSQRTIVDSTKTDRKGNFSFGIALPGGQATIYNVHHRGRIIPLLISPGEEVELTSISGISYNYSVEGSEGSEKVREINSLLSHGAASLDSVRTLYGRAADPEMRKKLGEDFTDRYFSIKREHIRFIVENAGSLPAVYALYQRLPGDEVLFNGDSDIVYYRLVADSAGAGHPDSPYVQALRKEVDVSEMRRSLAHDIEQNVKEVNFPEIAMQDMYGNVQRLSALEGKVILLDFWSPAVAESQMLNAELKELYEELHDRGFEVYQVSLEASRSAWVTAVQHQRLPWISVNDFKGAWGEAPMLYNVSSVPANFLIDRNGNIAARNLYGEDLGRQLRKLIK